ncbi:FAD binding domain-containing protein [Halobacterium wangiae]|uniref:FAD binding domain-containing protein n=1 Tax=Halobacterium wangiae TaxID=2902623 RepID=UPI001E3C1814|nr:xanthine dehydrogenase family protein subunit M [Halobacterium wangiae]
MFPDEFDYHEAESVDHAVELLGEYGGQQVELLAGGHSLLPAMKTGLSSPDVLVDLGDVDELHGVRADGDTLSIGAMTRYSDLLDADAAREHAPAMTAAVAEVGDAQVRNRGTVGGNLAHADPASDLPGAALVSDATLVAQGPDGEREIPAEEFFYGMYATDLAEDELLTRVEVPVADGAVGAYAKKPSPSSGYAIIGVSVLLDVDGSTVTDARVGANGVVGQGVLLPSVADAIEGGSIDDDSAANAASRATDDVDEAMLMDDLQASGEFRAQLLEVYAERALLEAAEEASAPAAAD